MQKSYLRDSQAIPCEADQYSDLDIFEMLSSLLVTIARSEQILQSMREVLITDSTFTPMSLFKYLAGSCHCLTRSHLVRFLDENNVVSCEKDCEEMLKKVFLRYGITSGQGIEYSGYLNFIYPYQSGVLRDLQSNKIKKYEEFDKINKSFRPSDSVITAFLLILEEEIKIEKKIEIQINDNRFPGKDRLKKVIKSIKRASQKNNQSQQKEETIQMADLRNFINAFIEVQDHLFLDVGRRLGMTKSGEIPIENILNVLKKTKRLEWEDTFNNQVSNEVKGVRLSKSRNEGRHLKEISFKEDLYKELEGTMKPIDHRNKTPRSKSRSQKSRSSSKKNQPHFNPESSSFRNNCYAVSNYENLINEENIKDFNKRQNNIYNGKHKEWKGEDKENSKKRRGELSVHNYLNNLFKEFIQTFLKGNKQIEEAKFKLLAFKDVDYLELFKTLDNGRGVVDAEDIKNLYEVLSGSYANYDFQLLVDRFAQPEEKCLSFSEFSDIFRSSSSNIDSSPPSLKGTENYRLINGMKLSQQVIEILAEILDLTLNLEELLNEIMKKFKKEETEELFSLINVDSESKGFINYQELKKYLIEKLHMSISMLELMCLLKRLDKSKNGVVLREEFLMS